MITHTFTEAELAEALHDQAMAKDPQQALVGRGMKELAPVLVRFLAAERDRGTDISTLIPALGAIMTSLHVSGLLGMTGSPKVLAPVLGRLIEHTMVCYAEGKRQVEHAARGDA